MAPNTMHRRGSANPEAPSSTLKSDHSKPYTANNSEPCLRSQNQHLLSNVNRLNSSYRAHTPSKPFDSLQKPPRTSTDVRFQAKDLSLSADFDSAYSLKKIAWPTEKQRRKTDEPPRKQPSVKFDDLKKRASAEEAVVDIGKFDNLALGTELCKLSREGAGTTKRRSSVSSSMAGGIGRRPLCGRQVELEDVFASNAVKVVSVDMPPLMQVHAVDSARKAYDSLEKFSSKSLALSLKKEFDGVYGPAWHCIVGTSFGSFVTHSVGGFIYFSMDHKMYILLFKTNARRAD
ncbi:hypothetical protein SAY86_003334 [Trapa natans]|uniref:Dynein light chain n=1 Tax=Trapa natans TaxID=22666 RepID=A0AAN7ME06_TRANT|nr:hypothetical protein SAY86_003334 [Trapa natans]